MKCLILAAGYATRLYPLTENFPKPLLKVRDKAILDWLIDDIKTSGAVDEYVVISNHKFAGHFTEWADGRPDDRITVVDDGTSTNDTRLGAVRDIQFAIDSLGLDDDMLVIAGDNVLDFSLVRFIEYANAKGTSCIMRFFEPSEQRLRKCGVVEVNDEDLILSMEAVRASLALVLSPVLFLHPQGRAFDPFRNLGRLRHRRPGQLHRMAGHTGSRARHGDAGPPL